MYSCPTDDIHSVYLDNELPLAYIKEYEAHVQNCEKCKKKLESLRSLKNIFAQDSKNISDSINNIYLEQSFERLQTKLRYSKTTVKSYKLPQEIIKWSVAAAAVIIAAIIPISISNSSKSSVQSNQIASIAPVARPQNVPIANKSVVVNGNLNSNYVQPVGTQNSSRVPVNAPQHSFNVMKAPRMYTNGLSASLTDVDVLRPDFDESNKISIKITIPGLDADDNTMEIKLPVNMYSGNLSEQN